MTFSEITCLGDDGAHHFRIFWHALIQSGTLTGVHLPCGELDAGSDIQFQSWISDFIQVLKIQ